MAWSAARSVRHRLHMLQCAPPIAHSAHASTCCIKWSSCLVWPAGGATSPRGPSRATTSPTARCLGPGLVGFGRPLVPHAFGRATVLGNTVGVCVCAARFGAQADAAASGFEAIHSDRHCSQISAALNAWLAGPIWVSGRPAALHESSASEPLGCCSCSGLSGWFFFRSASSRASGRVMLSGNASNGAVTVVGLSFPSIAATANHRRKVLVSWTDPTKP